MTMMRFLGLLFLFLTVNGRGAEPQTLQTGLQALPGALPNLGAKDPALDVDFDLPREKFFVVMPKAHKGDEPYGLLVFINPADSCTALPQGWADVLEKHHMIFVAPQDVGNERAVSRRAGLAVLTACKLPELVRIDPARVYVAGFSGGARVASYVAFLRPSLFSGVFALCGIDFPHAVPRVKATENDPYGRFTLDDQRIAEAKKKVKFVLVTGSQDFRYGNILDIFAGGYEADGYAVKLIDVPGMQHAPCPPNALSDGLAFLGGEPPKKTPAGK